MSEDLKRCDVLAIFNVEKEKKEQLKAIAKNNFTTMSALLKPAINELIENYPESDKRALEVSVSAEIQVTNFSPEKKEQLKAIAKNNFTTISTLLKPVINKLIESYPELDRVAYDY